MKTTKLLSLILLFVITFYSCKKDDGTDPATVDLANFNSAFNGTMRADGIVNSLEGIMSISGGNHFSLELLSGTTFWKYFRNY